MVCFINNVRNHKSFAKIRQIWTIYKKSKLDHHEQTNWLIIGALRLLATSLELFQERLGP